MALALNGVLLLPLTVLLMWAGVSAPAAALVVLVVPVAIEIGQFIVAGRVCSVADAVANAAGAIPGVWVGILARRLPLPRPPAGLGKGE